MCATPEIPFDQLLDALLDEETPLNPRFLYRLSDIEEPEFEQFRKIWPDVAHWRRLAIMEDVEQLSSDDTLLSFLSIGLYAIQDEDPQIRLLAVRTMWEYEEKDLIPLFLSLMEKDNDEKVRAAAAGALGNYVYLGELEELPERTLREIEGALIRCINSDDLPVVRRAALESLGFSGQDEVNTLIQTAFASDDKEWVASALFAMGRSANKIWRPQVISMLEHKRPLIRCEAARAAGELEFVESLPILVELIDDPDENTRDASIWSLSQVGGEEARELLGDLYNDAEDEEEVEFLSAALENLEFNLGMQLFPIIDFMDDEVDDLDEDYDLFSDDEVVNY